MTERYTSTIVSPVMRFSGFKDLRVDGKLYAQDSYYFKNIYLTLEGHFAKLPFDAKKDGLWLFDGQVFYPAPKVSFV